MESLTTSCYKPLFYGVASPPRLVSAFHYSNRLEFSFTNNKLDNFRFLQIVQNKGISPVHASGMGTHNSNKSQEHLKTEEPRAQETEEIRIKFQLQKKCMFGEQFLIVGDHPKIGAWDPSNARPMTWSEGHQWSVETLVPADKSIKYKFILKSVSGDIIWQPGPDRIVKTRETVNRIIFYGDLENDELQQIQFKFILNSVSVDTIWQLGPDRTVKTWKTKKIIVSGDWENAGLQKIQYTFIPRKEEDNSNAKPMLGPAMSKAEKDNSNVEPKTDSAMSNSSKNSDQPEKETGSNASDAQDDEDSKPQEETGSNASDAQDDEDSKRQSREK